MPDVPRSRDPLCPTLAHQMAHHKLLALLKMCDLKTNTGLFVLGHPLTPLVIHFGSSGSDIQATKNGLKRNQLWLCSDLKQLLRGCAHVSSQFPTCSLSSLQVGKGSEGKVPQPHSPHGWHCSRPG